MKKKAPNRTKVKLTLSVPPEFKTDFDLLSEETGILISRLMVDAGRAYATKLRADRALLEQAKKSITPPQSNPQ